MLVAAHCVPALFDAPAKPIADQDPAVSAAVRAAMASLAEGKLPAGANEELGARFTPAVLARVAEALGEAGTLRSVALLARKDEDAGRSLRYRYSYHNETLLVSVVLDGAGKFKRLNFSPE